MGNPYILGCYMQTFPLCMGAHCASVYFEKPPQILKPNHKGGLVVSEQPLQIQIKNKPMGSPFTIFLHRLKEQKYLQGMAIPGIIWIYSFADALISKPKLDGPVHSMLIRPEFSKDRFFLTTVLYF